MTDQRQRFFQMKEFVGFGAEDATNLRTLAPLFEAHGGAITDRFYERLAANPETAALITGRVDRLKATHARWMSGLFQGMYGDAYFEERWRIGLTHVRASIPPHWVEAVTSFLRSAGLELIIREVEPAAAHALCRSYLKILDLDLWIINLAYRDEQLARLTNFTGMSRALLDRCVLQGK